MIKLDGLRSLIKTPDFDGIPNLERFIVEGSSLLEEIHPSFGRLEKLVCVHIQNCENLKMVPPITRSKKLKTLVFSACRSFNNFLPHNMNHTGVWFFSGCLRKLVLSNCSLTDGDINSAAGWELPNLLELNLQENGFVRLDFSLLLLPQLKCLDIRYCKDLVELSELPLSIAVVLADGCFSLESFGDISNCKWLWKVTLTGNHKLGPLVCDMLLNSMLLGNAKHYFISINLSGIDIWSGPSVVWINWVKACNMTLPHDWYNHFSGILMFVRSEDLHMGINISIKQGLDEDFQSQIWQESDETPDPEYQETCVGYVSFSSLRHTRCLNSTYNIISFSFGTEDLYGNGNRFRAVLIPKDYDPMQTTKVTTDWLDFWDEEDDSKKTFRIRHDLNSSIEILWRTWV